LFEQHWYGEDSLPAHYDLGSFKTQVHVVGISGPAREAFNRASKSAIQSKTAKMLFHTPLRADEAGGTAVATAAALTNTAPAGTSDSHKAQLVLGADFATAFAHSISTGIASLPIGKESKQESESMDEAMNVWRVLLARVESTEGSNDKVVVLAALSQDMTSLMREKKMTKRARLFAQRFEAHIRRIKRGENRIAEGARFRSDQWDTPTVNAIFEPDLLDEGFFAGVANITRKFSSLQMLPIHENNQEFIKRTQHEVVSQGQDKAGEDEKKRVAKETKLFIHGSQHCMMDLVTAIFNWRAFLQFLSPDAEESAFYGVIVKFDDAFRQPSSRKWLEAMVGAKPYFIHAMVAHLQDAFAAFVRVATDPDVLDRVRNNGDIDPKLIENAALSGETQASHLLTGQGNGLVSVTEAPVTWSIFDKEAQKRKSDAGTGNQLKKQKQDGAKIEPAKKINPGNKTDPTNLGILVWAGSEGHLPPRCNLTFVTSKENKTRLRMCVNFAYRGFKCENKNCSFKHISRLSTLPEGEKTKLVDWVARTQFVAFAPGMGPTEGTAPAAAAAPAPARA
jgi:hypothetical protein